MHDVSTGTGGDLRPKAHSTGCSQEIFIDGNRPRLRRPRLFGGVGVRKVISMFNVRFQQFRDDPRFGAMYDRMQRKPGWVTKFTLIAAAIVVVVPIVAIALAAIVVGAIVFFVVSAIAAVMNFFSSLFGGFGGTSDMSADDGRRNVRVIPRE